MPPQQSDRLLDLFDNAFDFWAHDISGCVAAIQNDAFSGLRQFPQTKGARRLGHAKSPLLLAGAGAPMFCPSPMRGMERRKAQR